MADTAGSSTSTTPLPLTNEEHSLWSQVTQDMGALHSLRLQNDSALARMNKVHSKIADRQESKEGFSVKAAVKLGHIYKDAIEKAEHESRVLNRALERIGVLIALREATETGIESKRKKRKTDAKAAGGPKRARVSDAGADSSTATFQPGDQVVAKVEEWILANVVGYAPDKGKFEVEDAEDDEERPGTKKHYFLPSRLLIPIPKETDRRREFPVKHRVLALFPTTTCFYQASVVLPPSSTRSDHYVVIFEDDNNFERNVEARMVLEWPRHLDKSA
ncbi:hypothetical protein HK105_203958 [Polyrhizophydium stewartii]|uniref:SGF29 C-terminal domain-containing protein n=1 Tax=Polyrhizophydium stewartii TaxID=2732419 RepID=A0ABR4NAG5_9FUNG